MANNTRVIQVFEEAAPAVNIPIIVGNEMFMLTQQDVRRVEDTRYMCWKRWTPNEQLNCIPTLQPPNAYNSTTMTTERQNTVPMDFIANVSNQLRWSKTNGTSATLPLTYSVATSTNAYDDKGTDPIAKQHCSCQTNPQTCSKACNTEPVKSHNKTCKKNHGNESFSETSCQTIQDTLMRTPSESLFSMSGQPHHERKKSMVPPYFAVNEEHENQR
ncbi:uncharacterized protein LOC132785616 [Drosophila nasuta]|uniref:uncharacterized protein LOC132785616 n=1 Tax=Drosophila nasuta TaxID=42062 RepID=UPI00295E8E7C|nr:uncharacterized protein LOC132785616 [Drosophila nasuta]